MKIVLFSLLCLIMIGMISYSYAQFTSVDTKNTELLLPEVLLQLELRDSNGSLLTYIETQHIIGISPLELNRYLDKQTETDKEFFIKDDKKYESQQWEIKEDKFNQKLAYSTTRLIDIYQNDLVPLMIVLHDSFQTEPGDVLRIFWTVIRPVS